MLQLAHRSAAKILFKYGAVKSDAEILNCSDSAVSQRLSSPEHESMAIASFALNESSVRSAAGPGVGISSGTADEVHRQDRAPKLSAAIDMLGRP